MVGIAHPYPGPPHQPAPHGPAPPGETAEQTAEPVSGGSSGTALSLLAKVGSLGTALLFYFGWARMDEQARYLGYDSRVLDFSVQEYALKSVDVLFLPLVGLLILALLLRQVHRRVVVPVLGRYDGVPAIRVVVTALLLSLVGWSALALSVARAAPRLSGLAAALVATLAVLSTMYAAALRQGFTAAPRRSPTVGLMLAVLLGLALFWDTERLARLVGDDRAAQVVDGPHTVAVTVYSAKHLAITATGVTETPIGQPDSAYLYRYDGLRLVQRSGDRYYLISVQWRAAPPRVIVIRESDLVRLEFSR